MKLLHQKKIILFCIVFLGFILRFYRIEEIPPALSWDEVSIGYNAYTILKTGKDEHGRFLPLDTFIAYGDYKPPIPVYFTVPFVLLFGLNEISVRLPSVISGTIAILLTYLLVKELFRKEHESENISLLAAFVLAISPWHINISRAGFEANIATMFIILGVLWLLKSRSKRIFFYFCWLPFAAAIYTFNSARYFAPFIGLGFIFWQRKIIRRYIKEFVVGILIASLALLPIIPHLLSKEARLRFTEVNIFTDSNIVQQSNDRIAADGNTWWAKIIHNRRIGYTQSFFKHYLDHFEPSFLFIKGDGNPKFSIQDVGQLYLVELPLILLGLFYMLRRFRPQGLFLLFWLLTAIVPAATARETPHALRILTTLPTWQVFIAFGIVVLITRIRSRGNKRVFAGIVMGFLYGLNILFYLHNYYDQYPFEYSGEWQYGYKQAIAYAESVKGNYDQIVLSDVIGRPYAYVLFYTNQNPEDYWKTKNASFDAAGFYNVYGLGKYQFIRSSPPEYKSNVLYIMPPDTVPKEGKILKTINLLNGKPVLEAFEI